MDRKDTEDSLFVTASTSLQQLVTISDNHAWLCRHKQKIVKTVYRGHVVVNTLQCDNAENPHITKWSSSPYLPNNEFLVNHRMHHAITCSGMLPVHYTRFADTANIGSITKPKRRNISKVFNQSVKEAYKSLIDEALIEEIAWYEDLDGIDIMTDARHGWRKIAKDSSIVALGEKSHKVLQCVTVT